MVKQTVHLCYGMQPISKGHMLCDSSMNHFQNNKIIETKQMSDF